MSDLTARIDQWLATAQEADILHLSDIYLLREARDEIAAGERSLGAANDVLAEADATVKQLRDEIARLEQERDGAIYAAKQWKHATEAAEAKLQQCQQERDDWRGRFEAIDRAIGALQKDYEDAERQLVELRAYVQHKRECSFGKHVPGRGDPSETCTCGLSDFCSAAKATSAPRKA